MKTILITWTLMLSSCAFLGKHPNDFKKFKKNQQEAYIFSEYGKPDIKITDGYTSFFVYDYCPSSRNKQLLWAIPTLSISLFYCPSKRKKILSFKARRLAAVMDSSMSKHEFMGLAAGISNKIERNKDEGIINKYSVLQCSSRFHRELYQKECADWIVDDID